MEHGEGNSISYLFFCDIVDNSLKGGALAAVIDLQPQILDLSLYAGDGVSFRLICTDKAGAAVDVSGAVDAQVRLNRDKDTTPIIEFAANLVDAYQGIIVLSLTGDQTQALIDDPSSVSGEFTGVWDVQWAPSGLEPRTLCQGKVECVADVTRD